MRAAKLRVRRILTAGVVMLCILYGFFVFNVTIVSVQTHELEPSLTPGEVIFLTRDKSVAPGDVVAVEQAGVVRLRRVFAMGPITVNCVKQSGFVDDELVQFSDDQSAWLSADTTGEVSERWGSISVPIKRKMKLVPRTLSTQSFPTVVQAGELLVGCQNRIQCGGCGFESTQIAQVIGRMRESGWLHRWLGKASDMVR